MLLEMTTARPFTRSNSSSRYGFVDDGLIRCANGLAYRYCQHLARFLWIMQQLTLSYGYSSDKSP